MYIYPMNKWFLMALVAGLAACKSKAKSEDVTFFPVRSFLQSQVAHVDTSLYRITKVVTVDSTADTTYINREDFRREAKDFLSIPDIASEDLKDDYTEAELYDESLQSVILSYTPKDPDAEILREEVIIQPGGGSADKVKTIYIDQLTRHGNNTIRKNLLWHVDRRFQVTTMTRRPNGSEIVEKVQVIWDGLPSAE